MFGKNLENVNWLRKVQFPNGLTVSVSDKSGIVKLDIGAGRRNPNLYRDEIMALLACAVELQAFLKDNEDIAHTQEARKEHQKGVRFQMKAQANLAQTLESVPDDVIEKIIAARLASKKQA